MVIGIDPAFRTGGFYVCELENNTATFICMKSFLDFLDYIALKKGAKAVIENSNLQNVSFRSSTNKNIAAKMSRNVGANQAISQITVDVCIHFLGKENVKELSPLQKGTKWDNATMLAASKAHKLVNYKGLKGEQDKRDAYKLALFLK